MSTLYLGLMSGTSLDGIDAALFDFSTLPPHLVDARTTPLDDALRQRLLDLAEGRQDDLDTLGSVDYLLGLAFAAAATALLKQAKLAPAAIHAIGSHGQTVRHRPEPPTPFTLQIGDPNLIAEHTGITTVADFRRRDMAAGGQGAPMVPAFHAACFRSADEDRAILNVGGMANLTILPANPEQPVRGFDTGPGNVLMDAWIGQHENRSFDADGAWATTGHIHAALLNHLLSDAFIEQAPPKSTGREQYNLKWLQAQLGTQDYAPADVQATLCAFTAQSIADSVQRWAENTQKLLVCGGGAHNRQLLAELQRRLPGVDVETTEAYGLSPDWVEAAAFAWMARETLAGRPSNVPSVTGARQSCILGAIYPANITAK